MNSIASLDTLIGRAAHLRGKEGGGDQVSQDEINPALVEAGRETMTPAAVIEAGTWEHQRTVEGTLASITERASSLPYRACYAASGTEARAGGDRCSGRAFIPRKAELLRQISFSRGIARRISGKRCTSLEIAIRPSSRARGAPRQ